MYLIRQRFVHVVITTTVFTASPQHMTSEMCDTDLVITGPVRTPDQSVPAALLMG